ncbi:thioredoxin-like protein [Xylaria sp. CBS 124048]|nr:thioredoxin-like protein [Xylaria sp. CBS 124048]
MLVYADWCGPCKVIAPTFESLATKYSKPGRITFCKINVDNHQSITRNLGVTSMPTFLIFKRGSVINTIRGANAQALTAAVEQAIKMVDFAPGASFAAPGRTLGGIGSGSGAAPARTSSGNALGGRSLWTSLSPFHLLTSLLTFFGLYFVSLLSFDPYKSAERSDFNVKKPKAPPTPIKLGGNRPAGGPSGTSRPGGVRTLADLGGS